MMNESLTMRHGKHLQVAFVGFRREPELKSPRPHRLKHGGKLLTNRDDSAGGSRMAITPVK
jgi:hypothetical protein